MDTWLGKVVDEYQAGFLALGKISLRQDGRAEGKALAARDFIDFNKRAEFPSRLAGTFQFIIVI